MYLNSLSNTGFSWGFFPPYKSGREGGLSPPPLNQCEMLLLPIKENIHLILTNITLLNQASNN